MRLVMALAFVVVLGFPLLGAPTPALAASCGFSLGFKALRDLIPSTVGACLVDEHHDNASGDSLQETTGPTGAGGLLVWRKADNWTAFTDGNRTWINGPFEVESRFNIQRFLWEPDAATATNDVVAESDQELAVCSALPGSATGPIAAACFSITANKLILATPGAAQPSPTPAPYVPPPPPVYPSVSADGLQLTRIRGGWGHDQQGNWLPALFFTATNRTSGIIPFEDDRLFFAASFTDPVGGINYNSLICYSYQFLAGSVLPGGSGDVQCWGVAGYLSSLSFTALPKWTASLTQGNIVAGSRRPMGTFDVSGVMSFK